MASQATLRGINSEKHTDSTGIFFGGPPSTNSTMLPVQVSPHTVSKLPVQATKRSRSDVPVPASGLASNSASAGNEGSMELFRCKRRITFGQLGYALPQVQPATVARRNERERNRVKMVNMGFATLRQHVPNGAKNKKMSKVETLRSAVEYIKQLQQLLIENDGSMSSPSPSTASSASSASDMENWNPEGTLLASMQGPSSVTSATTQMMLTSDSPSCSVASSPTPSMGSDASPYDTLAQEDEDLLDLTSWFGVYPTDL